MVKTGESGIFALRLRTCNVSENDKRTDGNANSYTTISFWQQRLRDFTFNSTNSVRSEKFPPNLGVLGQLASV